MLEGVRKIRRLAGFAGREAEPVLGALKEVFQFVLRHLAVYPPNLGKIGNTDFAGILSLTLINRKIKNKICGAEALSAKRERRAEVLV